MAIDPIGVDNRTLSSKNLYNKHEFDRNPDEFENLIKGQSNKKDKEEKNKEKENKEEKEKKEKDSLNKHISMFDARV